ncbi:DUF6463 family protein [Cellulomonas cellasea]|uniref:Uncharacterized protein n=1 Tax=Cellulomonas cellasea TaxID=43670 RepID=A0A7W4YA39_9CELL|nr:DUF6463 family protein [Cellulomonas cellasea]MBB2921352.1 hypothetical protein [Cellulomonas cellasea]
MTTPAQPADVLRARARTLGWWVEVVAVGHLVVGSALFRDVIVDVARHGGVGAVPLRGDRSTGFWFLLASPAWWALGRELRAAEERGDRATQRRTGRAVAGISAAGAAMLPASPFWVLLALGLTAVRRAAGRDDAAGPGGAAGPDDAARLTRRG